MAMRERTCEAKMVHASVPVQSPVQPANCCPAPATAVKVTGVPAANDEEQTVPQLMPLGVDVTLPLPVTATFNAKEEPPGLGDTGTKVAVTTLAALTATAHVAEPVHAPDQAEKEYPARGAAVSATVLPSLKSALHALSQEIPDGDDVTTPKPTTFTASASDDEPSPCCSAGGPSLAPPQATNHATARQAKSDLASWAE